jgi:hypothetical protein
MTAVGYRAGMSHTTGNSSTFIGTDSGLYTTTGVGNTLVGDGSGRQNTTGYSNVAMGQSALYANTTGYSNNAIGAFSLDVNTTGIHNDAHGRDALGLNTTGSYNKAFGDHSLGKVTTGNANTAIGHYAGNAVTTGTQNLLLGAQAGRSGFSPFTATSHNYRVVVGSNDITNAYIKVGWTTTSDQRDKADITNFTHGLDYVNELRPVNFVWDDRSSYEDGVSDGSKKKSDVQLGFLAQEVQAVETGLGIDNNAIIDTEQSDLLKMTETKLIPVLVNAIQELSTENEALKARLTAGGL